MLIRGRYEVVAVAGRGGQGEVVRARDLQHDRDVAIKIRDVPEGARDEVLSEARILLGLRPHPNLPLVREDFFEDERYHMVVDWVAGTPLDALLAERGDPGLPPTTVMGYLAQVADALDHLHAHRPPIVHQDVKPANLILNEQGQVILVDFGIAGAPEAAVSAGTAGFMAPEIGAGLRPSPASDIYSLAATAFALLTGAPPGGARPSWEGIESRVSDVIERALRRALATDPARRPGSARDMVEQLRGWLGTALPTGVVTFLLTAVDDAPQRWEEDPAAMTAAIAVHDALTAEIVEQHHGTAVGTRSERDTTISVFPDAAAALHAAVELQRRVIARTPLRLSIAVHTGEAEVRAGAYVGATLNRAASLRDVVCAGQILCSDATVAIAGEPAGLTLSDLGSHRIGDIVRLEHLFQVHAPGLPDEPASIASGAHNLPQQLTSFIGRIDELEAVERLLTQSRVASIVGLGGSGKTRLAIEVGRASRASFPGGVWLIELGGVQENSLVAGHLAADLGLAEEPGSSALDIVLTWCGERHVLLILDGVEGVRAGVCDVAQKILRASPNVKILISSLQPVGVDGEAICALGSLDERDAIALFADRARNVKSGFALTQENETALREICKRLDGIPLAVELAAARVNVLTPADIARRLDDRFKLLAGRDREKTMRAALDWSYEPLGEMEKKLFVRLAVFRGGWTLEAAERVCSGDDIDEFDVLDLMAALTDRSLILADETPAGMRYRMLQTVQAYALEKGGDLSEVVARHVAVFCELAEAGRDGLNGAQQRVWVEHLEADHENLRAAIERANDAEAIQIASALARFRRLRGHLHECREALERTLAAHHGADDAVRARGLTDLGGVALAQGDLPAARDALGRALDMWRSLADEKGISDALNNLGVLHSFEGEDESAQVIFEEVLQLRLAAGDRSGMVEVLNNLGNLATDGSARYAEALEIAESLHNVKQISDLTLNLGLAALASGNTVRAADMFGRALDLSREIGDVAGQLQALSARADVDAQMGRTGDAMTSVQEAIGLADQAGDLRKRAQLRLTLGRLSLASGDRDTARRALDDALLCAQESGSRSLVRTIADEVQQV